MRSLIIGIALVPVGCAHLQERWAEIRSGRLVVVEAPAADLPAPEGLRAASGEYRAIALKWDPLLRGDVHGYVLEMANERDAPFARLATILGRGALSYVDLGSDDAPLTDGAARFYRLRAFTPDGRLSAAASIIVVGTTAPLPSPPEGLRAYSRQPREVPLVWKASPDPIVAGYIVERSPAPDGPFEIVAELGERLTTSYIDAGLGDLRVLYYRVASKNLAGIPGAPSEAARAVTKPEPLPPLGLRVAEQRLGLNVLAWDANVETDLTAYQLFRVRESGSRKLVHLVSADAQVARDTGVHAGEIIQYALVATDRDGLESVPSKLIEVESQGYEIQVDVGSDGVLLAWNGRGNEGFERAQIVRTGWLSRRRTAYSDTNRYLDSDVLPGRSYRYTVTLLRPGAGSAPASEPVEVKIPKVPNPR
jgi:fibronectin type 3 domain-containing protein